MNILNNIRFIAKIAMNTCFEKQKNHDSYNNLVW